MCWKLLRHNIFSCRDHSRLNIPISHWTVSNVDLWVFVFNLQLLCLDNDGELFCGMVDQQKVFSLISSQDHCQRYSPSQISDMLQAAFEPAQNLSSGLVEWSYAVVITTTPWGLEFCCLSLLPETYFCKQFSHCKLLLQCFLTLWWPWAWWWHTWVSTWPFEWYTSWHTWPFWLCFHGRIPFSLNISDPNMDLLLELQHAGISLTKPLFIFVLLLNW